MDSQAKGNNSSFADILSSLLKSHPKTGEKTTLKTLGEYIGVRQQTVSLYKSGDTQPTPDNLVKIAEYFDVSVDYLLTGISSGNKALHEELSLSEEAIRLMRIAKETKSEDGTPLIELLNNLLSDSDLYRFLEELDERTAFIKHVQNNGFNSGELSKSTVEDYLIWELQKCVEEFILKQLKKRGLQIEDKTVS